MIATLPREILLPRVEFPAWVRKLGDPLRMFGHGAMGQGIFPQPMGGAGVAAAVSSLLTNLVAYWKLDETSGNRADSLGTYTLTDVNTVTSNPGKVGTAAQFTRATSEYFTLSLLSFADNTSWTFSAWMYMDDTNNYPCLFGYDFATGKFGRCFFVSTTSFGFATDANVLSQWSTGATYTSATWYHLLVRCDGTTDTNNLEFFMNGVSKGTKSVAVTTFSFNKVGTIGNGSNFHYGRMDEFGIWSRRVSDAEVATLYNAGNGVTYPDFA